MPRSHRGCPAIDLPQCRGRQTALLRPFTLGSLLLRDFTRSPGAHERARTADLVLTKDALYHLSSTISLCPLSECPDEWALWPAASPQAARRMERETGFEPATPSLEGSCSSQLSYSRPRASVEHRSQISCSRIFESPEGSARPGAAVTAAVRSFELESRTSGALRMVERGGFEPPKAEPADLQSAPFDRFGTSPVRQSSLNTKNTHRGTPHSRSCSVLSPPHPQAKRSGHWV